MSVRSVAIERSLILRQPWAQAVADGAFPLLLRSTGTTFRGWVGIYAAKTPDPSVSVEKPLEAMARGAIVGAIRIEDSLVLEGDARAFLAARFGRAFADFYPPHFIPAKSTCHVWLLGEALALAKPRPWQKPHGHLWATTPVRLRGETTPLLSARPRRRATLPVE